MTQREKYFKKATVLAVKLNFEAEGFTFTYKKWDGIQRCQPGDYLVRSNDLARSKDDVYTVDRETFERTYEEVSPDVYKKTEAVWAEVAERDGKIRTREGETHFKTGDYIVFNDEDDEHGWAVAAEVFEATYEPAT